MMKQLILILVFMASILMAIEHTNPNGKPGTLNIYFGIENDSHEPRIDIDLPVYPWLTVNGGYLSDRYEHGYGYFNDVGTYQFDTLSTRIKVFYVGAEFHLPLYKLWE
tara:strand:- start:1649 stop:1972 length:324 start_codon:yes stop_codon:yes gene_type:complete